MMKIASLRRLCVLLVVGATGYVILPLLRFDDVNTETKSTAGTRHNQSLGSIHGSSIAQPHASRVIILAYMRTGSSMTGSIFNNHPDVFYWYEPLHALGHYYSKWHRHLNKTERHNMFIHSQEASGNMSAFLHCDVARVFRPSLIDPFLLNGHGTKSAYDCFSPNLKSHPDPTWSWENCINYLTNVCHRNYSMVVAKIIRLSMSSALELLRRDPELKVVHLVRDPRGILESRRRLSLKYIKDMNAEARELCARMSADLREIKGIQEESLTRRYMLVRYEDITTNPAVMAKMFYGFAGLRSSPSGLRAAQKLYRKPRMISKGKSCHLCRPNQTIRATAAWGRWRSTISLKDLMLISDVCSDVIAQLGYRVHFKNVMELLDSDVTAVGESVLNVASKVVHDVYAH